MRSSSSSSFPEPVRGTPFVGSIPSTAVTSPVPSPIEAPGTLNFVMSIGSIEVSTGFSSCGIHSYGTR